MPIQRRAIVFAFLCMLFNLNQYAAEESSNGFSCGCGFGYEVLLAKLEKIEERLEAMKEWQEAVSVHSAPLQPKQKINSGLENTPNTQTTLTTASRSEDDLVPAGVEHKPKPDGQQKVNLPIGIDPAPEQRQYGEDKIYSSCREVPSRVTGKYLIRLSDDADPVNLLCDMQSIDVGWIVVQQRFNGSETFYRGWNNYRDGFGNLDGEFWLGLERISTIVNDGRRWEIAFWLKSYKQLIKYARFDGFLLGNATEGYTLKRVGRYSGNAGDSISTHTGMKFTTYDRDNDPAAYNCAKKHRGGWWYHKACVTSNLNGEYVNAISDQANSWNTMHLSLGLQASKIMIREII